MLILYNYKACRRAVMKAQNKAVKDGKRGRYLFVLVFFVFTILSIIFGLLCLKGTQNSFIHRNVLAFSLVQGVFFITLGGFCIWFVLSNKKTLAKTFLSLYILILFCLILIFVFQKTGFFAVVRDAEKLQAYLERAGMWMPLFYTVLQFLQVVVLPIPSVVSTVVGVALFGPFQAMIYSLIGIVLGSITAFFIGRKLGYKAVAWMIGEETLEKWQKKMKGKDNLFLTLMFLLPLFPDDILCFVAGLSSMTTRYFLIMILASRTLAIAGTCYSIDFIPFNTWWGISLWTLFLIGVVVLFVAVYKNMDKIQRWLKKLKRKKDKNK